MDDKKDLLNDEDRQYELERIEQQKAAIEEEKRRKEQEAKDRKEYEKKLQEEHLELVKLKNGAITDSDIIKEVHEEKIELHGMAWVKNFWWHNKYIILLVLFFVAVFAYITYDTLSRTDPDMQIIMTCNNGLINRTDELEDLFEEYCEDLNGDGEVYVQVIEAPITSDVTDYTTTEKYQSVIQANLQTADIIFFVSDEAILSDESGVAEAFADLTEYYDSELVDENGLHLTGEYVQKKLKWESDFPDDMYIAMREPVKTLKDSKSEMQENFDTAKEIMDQLVEDFTTHYEEETSN